MKTLKHSDSRCKRKRGALHRAIGGLLGIVFGAFILAGCVDEGPDALLSSAEETSPNVTAEQQQACAIADFDDFDDGDEIESFTLAFGGAVGMVSFDVDVAGYTNVSGTDDESQDKAFAFDVARESEMDEDLQDTDGDFGYCSDCNGQGIFLIIPEMDFENNGDSDAGGEVTFTRSDGESFLITSFLAADQEEEQNEGMILYRDGTPVTSIEDSYAEDGETTTVNNPEDTFGDAFMFEVGGSGAIDDVEICVEEPEDNGGGQGCTPGYWKNHTGDGPGNQQNAWAATGYDPDDEFCSIFDCGSNPALANPESGNLDDLDLLDALKLRGGKINALLRHTVAALLNASHPDVSYDLSVSEVIEAFNDALDDGSKTAIEEQKEEFETFNEQGCPLS